MAVVFDYVGKVELLSADAVPKETHDEWVNTLAMEQSHIGTNLLNKIPDEPTFKALIADMSSDRWEGFVNPDWPLAELITIKQRVKLARAYASWRTGVLDAFFDGYFAARVRSKRDKWLLARYTISLVGLQHDPDIRWRAGTKAVKFFVGDTRILRYMDSNLDTYTGSPTYVVKDAFGKFFQALTIGQLVYGYVMAKFADEAGLDSVRDNIINTINSNMDTILSCALDTSKADPAKSYLHLSYSAGDFYVRAHAEI